MDREQLPAERVEGLRQLIHSQVNRSDVHAKVRGIITEMIAKGEDLSEAHIQQVLRDRGIVDEVVNSLGLHERENASSLARAAARHHPPAPAAAGALDMHSLPPLNISKRYVYVSFHGGRAFLEPVPREGGEDATLALNVSFNGQRFRGKHVAASAEPAFVEGFLFELPATVAVTLGTALPDPFLGCTEPVHIAVTRHEPGGDVALLACHRLEWRALALRSIEAAVAAASAGAGPSSAAAGTYQAVEAMGVGASSSLPAGVLHVRVDVLPAPAAMLDVALARSYLTLERARMVDAERIFLVYARRWWAEFLEMRPSHQQRLVKIFASDEGGVSHSVCSFVQPLSAGRLLDTPRHAARFVSLMPYERMPAIGDAANGRIDMWSHPHAFLARGRGDVEDHALLLCSLLLGFGLDAFVCLGTKLTAATDGRAAVTAHAWVASFSADGSIVFWESLTAERFLHRGDHPFRTVDCVFNHRLFFANIQPSTSLVECSMELRNEKFWKSMSADALAGPSRSRPPPPPLLPCPIDPAVAAFELERELRGYLTDSRAEAGLGTAWDSNLAHILQQALHAYELQRCTGVVAGNEEFQAAIKHTIPPGYTFKGYPAHFLHLNGYKIFSACRAAAACDDIVFARGDQVVHAVRVRVFPYAERAAAVWLMFAVSYRSII